MGKFTYIIDAGHGGVDANGHYTTDPKKNKRWKFEDGLEILEGVTNRAIAKKLHLKLQLAGISFALIYDDVADVSLTERVRRANKMADKSRCCLISIHSNAGHGKGFEFFTSPGFTTSDTICGIFINKYRELFPEFPFRTDRSDGDDDKEEKFTMLTGPLCPAILIENLFFDTRSEAEFLLSEEGQERLAEAMYQSILEVEKSTI